MCSVRSTSGIRAISVLPATAAPPNRHSIAPVACSENIEKFTPAPSQVAPSGYGKPGRISNLVFGILKMTLMASRTDDGNRCGISERPDGLGRAKRRQNCPVEVRLRVAPDRVTCRRRRGQPRCGQLGAFGYLRLIAASGNWFKSALAKLQGRIVAKFPTLLIGWHPIALSIGSMAYDLLILDRYR